MRMKEWWKDPKGLRLRKFRIVISWCYCVPFFPRESTATTTVPHCYHYCYNNNYYNYDYYYYHYYRYYYSCYYYFFYCYYCYYYYCYYYYYY